MQDLEDSEKNNDILRKRLTSDSEEYDSIGIPKLNIQQLQGTLKLADKFTLQQVVELLKIDYIDMIGILAGSLEKQNKYELSIASESIRRRTQSWIEVLSKHSKDDNIVDRAKGQMK